MAGRYGMSTNKRVKICQAKVCVNGASSDVHIWVSCERNVHSALVKHRGTLENAAWTDSSESPTLYSDLEISWG